MFAFFGISVRACYRLPRTSTDFIARRWFQNNTTVHRSCVAVFILPTFNLIDSLYLGWNAGQRCRTYLTTFIPICVYQCIIFLCLLVQCFSDIPADVLHSFSALSFPSCGPFQSYVVFRMYDEWKDYSVPFWDMEPYAPDSRFQSGRP